MDDQEGIDDIVSELEDLEMCVVAGLCKELDAFYTLIERSLARRGIPSNAENVNHYSRELAKLN